MGVEVEESVLMRSLRMKRRDAARRYREQIKKDPVKYYEYKLKDAMRKRRKKLEMLTKSMSMDS